VIRTKSALRWGTIALSGTALLWAVYVGLTRDMVQLESSAPSKYEAVAVERGDLAATVVATGTMEPYARVVVQSEIPGLVVSVHIDDGDRIERGQPLVTLDRARLEDRAAELNASLAFERARARIDLIGRARAERAQARLDHERAAELAGQGVVSREQIDRLAHALHLAEIALGDAHAEHLARLAATDRARMALRRVERDLEKSVIRSPIDGIVIRRRVEVGAAVADLQNGGTVVALLADDRAIHLLGEVDENDIAGVRREQPVDVRIDAFPGEVFAGHVRKISSAGDTEGGVSTFEVEIELDPDERVRVGMSADAHIAVRQHTGVLLIPNAAIERTPNGPQVRRVDVSGTGSPALSPIREIYSDGFRTAVAEGLVEDDRVLVRSRDPDADPHRVGPL
jgi:HlyD family secretion protein